MTSTAFNSERLAQTISQKASELTDPATADGMDARVAFADKYDAGVKEFLDQKLTGNFARQLGESLADLNDVKLGNHSFAITTSHDPDVRRLEANGTILRGLFKLFRAMSPRPERQKNQETRGMLFQTFKDIIDEAFHAMGRDNEDRKKEFVTKMVMEALRA